MYSPHIEEDIVRRLYRIGKHQHIPMTRLVNKILDEWIRTFYTEQMIHAIEERYHIR